MKKERGGGKGGLGRCLGAPARALSRACDAACHLYVRGMSGCARLVPETVVVGRSGGAGFGGSATAMHLRVSSDRGEDLVRAALKQRSAAACKPPPAGVVVIGPIRKGALSQVAPAVQAPARKKGAAMGTIAEDAPSEFAADGAGGAAPRKPPAARRRGAEVDGLAARAGGFGAIKVGSESEAFAR